MDSLSWRAKREGFDLREFSKFINTMYEAENPEDHFIQKKTFSPSSLGYGSGTCARYWYLAFNGQVFERTAGARSMGIMTYGTKRHGVFQDFLVKSGLPVVIEQEVNLEDPPIRGFIDAVMTWKGKTIPIEHKTTFDIAWEWRNMTQAPTPAHRLQLLIYMLFLGVDIGVFTYENKNDQRILPLSLHLDEKNIAFRDAAFDWMRRVHKAYKDDLLPKRSFNKNNKICAECPVRKACDAAPVGNEKFEVLNLKDLYANALG